MQEKTPFFTPPRISWSQRLIVFLLLVLLTVIGATWARSFLEAESTEGHADSGAMETLTPTVVENNINLTTAPTEIQFSESSPTPVYINNHEIIRIGLATLSSTQYDFSSFTSHVMSLIENNEINHAVEFTQIALSEDMRTPDDFYSEDYLWEVDFLIVWQTSPQADGSTFFFLSVPVPLPVTRLVDAYKPAGFSTINGWAELGSDDLITAEITFGLISQMGEITDESLSYLSETAERYEEAHTQDAHTNEALQTIWLLQSIGYAVTEDYDASQLVLDRLLETTIPTAAISIHTGNLNFLSGDTEGALIAYELANQKLPDLPAAKYNLIMTQLTLGEYDSALQHANQTVNAYPDSVWAINLRGMAYYAVGDYLAAQNDFAQAQVLDPLSPTLIFNEALALAKMEDYSQSLVKFDYLIEEYPEDPVYHYYFGTVVNATGSPEQAERAFAEALDLAPTYTEAYLLRGRLYLEEGNAEAALADAESVLALEAGNGDALWLMGDALFAQGRYLESIDAYDFAMLAGINEIDLYLQRGWAYQNSGDKANAVVDYESAISLGLRDDPDVLIRLGFAYLDTFRYSQALEVFREASLLEPDNAEVYAGMAVSYEALFATSEAEELYAQALALNDAFGESEYLNELPLWSYRATLYAEEIIKRLH